MDPGVIKGIPKEDMEKERLNSSEPVDPTARFCPVCNHWQVIPHSAASARSFSVTSI